MELGISYKDELDLISKFLGFYNFLLEPQLSEKEIKLTACILLQNLQYIEKGVKDLETRLDLLTTKKSKDSFKLLLDFKAQELENYLSKIKKKGIFQSNLFKVQSINDLLTLNITYVKLQEAHRDNNQRSS